MKEHTKTLVYRLKNGSNTRYLFLGICIKEDVSNKTWNQLSLVSVLHTSHFKEPGDSIKRSSVTHPGFNRIRLSSPPLTSYTAINCLPFQLDHMILCYFGVDHSVRLSTSGRGVHSGKGFIIIQIYI